MTKSRMSPPGSENFRDDLGSGGKPDSAVLGVDIELVECYHEGTRRERERPDG